MSKLQKHIDSYLTKKGFSLAVQRVIKVNAFLICMLFCISLFLLPYTDWLFWLSCASFLSFWNFFFMAFFVQKSLEINKISPNTTRSFILKQFFLSNLRLFITGILLYYLLVILRANPFALAIGLAVPLFMIPILLLTNKKIPF